MKKHLLGFGIFSFIVVSFALAFASFYVPEICPITQIEETPRTVVETDTRYRCKKQETNTRFEVISSQFDLDSNKLISQIRIKLGKNANTPKKVKVKTMVLSSDKTYMPEFYGSTNAEINTFVMESNDTEAVFVVVSELSKSKKIEGNENLYANFDLTVTFENGQEIKNLVVEPTAILFIHGKSSVIKKNMKSRDELKILY